MDVDEIFFYESVQKYSSWIRYVGKFHVLHYCYIGYYELALSLHNDVVDYISYSWNVTV